GNPGRSSPLALYFPYSGALQRQTTLPGGWLKPGRGKSASWRCVAVEVRSSSLLRRDEHRGEADGTRQKLSLGCTHGTHTHNQTEPPAARHEQKLVQITHYLDSRGRGNAVVPAPAGI